MINPSIRWTLLFYGALLIALGIVGYQTSHSKISLIMGCVFGLSMIASSGLLFYEKRFGLYAATILTALLTLTFSYRYIATHGSLPAFMALLSGAMLFYLLSQSVRYKK